jgi:hypothetical protein
MADGAPSGSPGPSEAKVVFYRTDVTGDPCPFPVYADKRLVGYPERGTYFEVLCEPGNHVFSSPGVKAALSWPASGDAVVSATLDPGKTYYIQAYSSGDGWGSVFAHLKPLNRNDSRWARVEKKVWKLQCRALAQGTPDLIRKLEPKDGEVDPDGPRLNPEDGQ